MFHDEGARILSDLTVFMKYARYLPDLKRRETWDELVTRCKDMHIRKYPNMREEIQWAFQYVYDRAVLPSMRSLQFAGRAIELAPNRGYNCAYFPASHTDVFSEAMFLLLGGTGLGFSVQKHHVRALPPVRKPRTGTRRYLIGDSIEGWADSVKVLMEAYFSGGKLPLFDFRDIRAKGEQLITAGGKAPGPEPLYRCLHAVESILRTKDDGEPLYPIEVHDIFCHIADAVRAGGIRRAALISFFSVSDKDMLNAKKGDWWTTDPQRGRANNSAVFVRHRASQRTFKDVWSHVVNSGSGEPGVCFTNDKDDLGNPCMEISLKPMQMCNLCEINVSNVTGEDDFRDRARAAAIIGTLQAGYTNFHYLRPQWQETCEKEALLGIGMTGIASGNVLPMDLSSVASDIVRTNTETAAKIGIRPAARTTCVKPSGTSSLVLGCSSGVHDWHAPFYIRRIRVGKEECLYQYLAAHHPELLEDDVESPNTQAVISIPQRAPTGASCRTTDPIPLLERIKDLHLRWIQPGHTKGNNSHNVSATVSVPADKWDAVGNWMWENRDCYNGISVLPYDDHTYRQAPFEECDEETYNRLSASLRRVDLTQVVEDTDQTELSGEVACAGGACEVR